MTLRALLREALLDSLEPTALDAAGRRLLLGRNGSLPPADDADDDEGGNEA